MPNSGEQRGEGSLFDGTLRFRMAHDDEHQVPESKSRRWIWRDAVFAAAIVLGIALVALVGWLAIRGKRAPERPQVVLQQPVIEEGDTILAHVEGIPVTLDEVTAELAAVPEARRKFLEKRKHLVLQHLINMKVLLHKAREAGTADSAVYKQLKAQAGPGLDDRGLDMVLVSAYVQENFIDKIEISDEEAKAFFDRFGGQFGIEDFEEGKAFIKSLLKDEKVRSMQPKYVNDLVAGARVEINREWFDAQVAAAPKSGLDEASAKGLPVMVQFVAGPEAGAGRMSQFMPELARQYEGKIAFVTINADEFPDVAAAMYVRVAPTQVILDPLSRTMLWRHEGFLEQEKLQEVLADVAAGKVPNAPGEAAPEGETASQSLQTSDENHAASEPPTDTSAPETQDAEASEGTAAENLPEESP